MGADNAAIECIPFDEDRFLAVHIELLVKLGITLVEHLQLKHMAADKCYSALFVVAPMLVTGGSGSPVQSHRHRLTAVGWSAASFIRTTRRSSPNPYPVYDRRRACPAPAYNAELSVWFLLRFADVLAAASDPEMFSSAGGIDIGRSAPTRRATSSRSTIRSTISCAAR